MPQTAHRLDAADLLELGTYSLRRALDSLLDRSQQLAADQEPAWSVPDARPRPATSAAGGRPRVGPST
jgi:hypothetical protein